MMKEDHKKHVLGALDHIDGILGDVMHQSKQKLGEARQAIYTSGSGTEGRPDPKKPATESNYEEPAPHAGEEEVPDEEVEGASHRKGGGGKNVMWNLLNR